MDEYQTIHHLLTNRASIARYGDGELKLCIGRSAKSQKAGKSIQRRLREILQAGEKTNCLVGIPRIYSNQDQGRMSERKWRFWKSYTGSTFRGLYSSKKVYGSAFITRPDAAPEIDCVDYFELVKSIWKDKDVFVMHGKGTGFLKSISLLDGAKKYEVVAGPIIDAHDQHSKLLRTILDRTSNDMVILLSLGPEATVLAYDLATFGRQALDLGHMGMFYAHIHPKDKNWNGVRCEVY
jgi:glycosyltransferase family protein